MIGVIGDVILDRYKYYKTTGVCREGGAPAVLQEKEIVRAGGCGNILRTLDTLRSYPVFLSNTYGYVDSEVVKEINEYSILWTQVFLESAYQEKTRHYIDNKLVFKCNSDEPVLEKEHRVRTIQRLKKYIPKLDTFVISNYYQGLLASDSYCVFDQGAIKLFNKRKTVLLDSRKNADIFLRLADHCSLIVKLNRSEYEALTELTPKQFCVKNNLKAVIMTDAHNGVWSAYQTEDTVSELLLTGGKEFENTIGAGDIFISKLAYDIDQGLSFEDSLLDAHKYTQKVLEEAN